MTSEQEALLRKARDSVDAARMIVERHPEFAASRAYYAMFYVAEAFLVGRGLRFSKHSAVHAAFGKHFAKAGLVPTEMHRYLIEAARIRNLGDYGLGSDVDPEVAQDLIAQAEEFIGMGEQRIPSLSSETDP